MTEPVNQMTDGALLASFVATGNQGAFAEIVQRHGAMVHSVCLRVLGDHHEAQDATQAVFLTLARKAAVLRKDPSVGGWLHTVARRLAKDLRRSRLTRRQREETAMRDPSLTEGGMADSGLFREALDEAIGDLPERYRHPLVLFHLEGLSLERTALRLTLNASTTGNRLARARELLRKKLVRRGVTVGSVGALTALLSAESGAAVLPATFVASTVKAATGGTVSTTVAALTKGALNMLFWNSVKTVALTAACAGVVGTSVVVAQRSVRESSLAPAPQRPDTTNLGGGVPKGIIKIERLSELVALTVENGRLTAQLVYPMQEGSPQYFETVAPPGFWGVLRRVEGKSPAFNVWEWRPVGNGPVRFQISLDEQSLYLQGPQGPDGTGNGFCIRQSVSGQDIGCSLYQIDENRTVTLQTTLQKASAANWDELWKKLDDRMKTALTPIQNWITRGNPFAATKLSGDSGKVFKPIDQSQSGFYADGKWSYAYEVRGDQRQGVVKYDAKDVGHPQPGDYIQTPWGWMQWQEKGHWLPVAEKPATGTQLPDPGKK